MKKTADSKPDKMETWFIILSQLCMGFFVLIFTSFFLLLLIMGLPRLNWDFLVGLQSRFPDHSGVLSALTGTCELIVLVIVIAVPLGILTAVFLEEYGETSANRFVRRFSRFCDYLFSGMEAVPSVVYGFLGLALFTGWLSLGRTLLAAALTLSALAVPMIVSNCRKALQSVSWDVRENSLALGASRAQSIRTNVLPAAFSGIISGTCMAMVRVSGEAAPLLVMGALGYMTFVPDGLSSPFAALPVEIYNWTVQPGTGMHANGAAAILILMPFLLAFNSIAVFWRRKSEKKIDGDISK